MPSPIQTTTLSHMYPATKPNTVWCALSVGSSDLFESLRQAGTTG
jgi:hypothetical protein